MSFYVKQYYEQAVETHDHAVANYYMYTHNIQAKDDLNNAMLLAFNAFPSLHIPHLRSKWKWKKTAWTCFGVNVPKTFDCPTVNLNPR